MTFLTHVVPISDKQAYIVVSTRDKTVSQTAEETAYDKVVGELFTRGLAVVHERVFGSSEIFSRLMNARQRAFRDRGLPSDNPVTYLSGAPPFGAGLSGIIINAVSQDLARPVIYGGARCGTEWRMDGLRYLLLQNLGGISPIDEGMNSRARQTTRVFETAEKILLQNGMTYRNTLRTWCYLDNILDWYDEFNLARREAYTRFGIMPRAGEALCLPASTGITARAEGGGALTVDLLAVSLKDSQPCVVKHLSNARQKDAFCYGSAFSRGALMEGVHPGVLQLSGTAAIDAAGCTMHVGDPTGQIEATLDTVNNLLETECTSLHNMAASVVFVKRPEYAELFWEIIENRGMGSFPAVCIVADVCRHDLLFEMDGEVVV